MSRRSRRIADLRDQVVDLSRAVAWERTEREAHRCPAGRYAVRLARMARATLRLRAELAAQQRVNDQLSNQLFSALGYTDAGLKAIDVPVQTTGREPGEVAS
ncbi:hypothetical protein [Streptomyces sp. NRRL S-1813]|uniref:hypothetical protein n=1 Tax=Streptomyces sp. NRRL S-1813 TaxID=1463888 RepID=UPI0004C518A0|nr:hypothetical protein [Streptomyces sp. NRRL S-1813]